LGLQSRQAAVAKKKINLNDAPANLSVMANDQSNASKREPLFPVSTERCAKIQSHFVGAYRHLAVHVFQALSALQDTGVDECVVWELIPELQAHAAEIAQRYNEPDVYANALRWADYAIGKAYRQQKAAGHRLHAFQVMAIAVLAFADEFIRVQKQQPANWHLHTDIALQCSFLATKLAQHTSAVMSALEADKYYAKKREEKRGERATAMRNIQPKGAIKTAQNSAALADDMSKQFNIERSKKLTLSDSATYHNVAVELNE
jgi:hypothetical protein